MVVDAMTRDSIQHRGDARDRPEQAEPRGEGCPHPLAVAAGRATGSSAGADRRVGEAAGRVRAAAEDPRQFLAAAVEGPEARSSRRRQAAAQEPPRLGRALEPNPDRTVDATLDAC